MQSFWAMVLANLKMTIRNRQAIFWNLAFPAIFILIFGAVFGDGQSISVSIGVAGAESPLREQFLQVVEESEAFSVSEGSRDDELAQLEEDDRDVVVVFPDPAVEPAASVELYSSETAGPTGQVAVGAVRGVLMEIATGGSGLSLEQETVTTQETSYIDFFVPGILGMSLMNTGVIGLSTAFVSYREQGILRRIKVTPFALWKFILARIVSSLVVALGTSAILIGISVAVWDMTVRGNPLLLLGVLIVGGLCFLAIGYAIAAIARNTEVAASYANLVTFPMLFLSGVFFPLGNMPDWIQPITRILPLRYLVDAIRQPMTYANGLSAVWTDLLILLAVFAVCMAFAIRFFRWEATPR